MRIIFRIAFLTVTLAADALLLQEFKEPAYLQEPAGTIQRDVLAALDTATSVDVLVHLISPPLARLGDPALDNV